MFKNRKFDEYQGKRVQKLFYWNGVSVPWKVSASFKKIIIEKMRFHFKKYDKYLKPKNDVKKLLGAFNHELWAI